MAGEYLAPASIGGTLREIIPTGTTLGINSMGEAGVGGIPSEHIMLRPENIPFLSEIPIRRDNPVGNVIVARHELQHALVSDGIVKMCVIPHGDIGGWTIVVPPKSDSDMHVILAAGEINTGGGSGDRMMSASLDIARGRVPGASFKGAQDIARSIIGSYDKDTIDIACEIIAWKGVISGDDLGKIWARAGFEAQLKKKNVNLKAYASGHGFAVKEHRSIYSPQDLDVNMHIPSKGDYLVVIEKDKLLLTRKYHDGNVISEEVFCPRCGGKGGFHEDTCALVKNRTFGFVSPDFSKSATLSNRSQND